MRQGFVKTENYARFTSGVKAVEARGAAEAGMMLVHGLPGLGKSHIVYRWAEESGAVYPYRSGAEVEDLGRRPRGVSVKAIFWQRNYIAEATALVKAFEENGKGELVHPLFGTQQVCVRSWSIEHEAEKRDYAAVDFEFVEASLDNPFFDAKSMRGLAATA